MGYNPTTHQVWIKIVGLPLQAWTTSEITAILRNFGQPVQILPFGQSAGHFRDITALVATNNPSRIPLAYTYREGEYATNIDIIILRWRQWEESYFPPPGDNNFPPQPQFQPQDQAGPSNPQHRSPSSSASSAAPTEPTIDLSAWSPRSHQFVSTTQRHNLQTARPRQTLTGDKWIEKWFSSLLETHRLREAPSHKRNHTLATRNPNLQKIPTLHLSLVYASLTTVPNPIPINPLCSLWTATSTTLSLSLSLGEAQERQMTELYCSLSLPRFCIEAEKSVGRISNVSNKDTIVLPRKELYLTQNTKSSTGPSQPTSLLISGLPHSLSLAQTQCLILAPNNFQNQYSMTEDFSDDPKSDSHVLNSQYQTTSTLSPKSSLLEPSDSNSLLEEVILSVQETGTHVTAISTLPKPQSNKQRATPTRRSQRILEKRSTLCPEQKNGKKSKIQVCKIPFLKDNHLTPLDASKTLEILQATGVVINKQVEDLIEEAVKQYQLMEDAEQSRPTTPIHDPIPPLAVPGTDLLL